MSQAIVYEAARNQPKTGLIMGPVAEGLRCAGWTVEMRESAHYPRGDENDADLLAVWGDNFGVERILRDAPRLRPRLLHIDNGYLNRNRYEGHYGLSWGARQCQAYLWDGPRPSADRFAALKETIRPWRMNGDVILVLAPSIKQGRFLGVDSNTWGRQIRDLVSRYTKKPIRVQLKTYTVDRPLRETLQNEPIFAAVGYQTKGLVECLLYGVPVFNLAPCVAERMGGQDVSSIERPLYPENRQEFFERLAHHQFLLREIAEGLPFRDRSIPA